jgi:protein gp37
VPGLTYDLPNVWLGVSVESPAYYARIRHLARTQAAVRFLSCEPLLAPLPDLPLAGIAWVIVGGESGPGARPMHPDWVRSIRDQCRAAGVAFFFKQWGEWHPIGPVYQVCRCGAVCDCDDRHEEISEEVLAEEDSHHEVRWFGADGFGEYSRAQIQPYGRTPWWLTRVGKRRAGRELDGRTWDEYPAPHPWAVAS